MAAFREIDLDNQPETNIKNQKMNLIYNNSAEVTALGFPPEVPSKRNAGKFGVIDFISHDQLSPIERYKGMTKIVFIRSGSRFNIDLKECFAAADELYFLRPDQYLQLGKQSSGSILYYTDQLYFADLEDQELLYGGMLFNNVHENLSLKLEGNLAVQILSFFEAVRTEIGDVELNQESMVRGLIKQLIVLSIRAWKNQHARLDVDIPLDRDFTRLFDRLVEQHFRTHHTVAAYAKMLHITPKALTKRFGKCGKCTPSEVIRKRIVLEAKRMLVHTALNVKEIGYKLGYEDPCYFIRFFTKQVSMAPQTFRRYFQSGLSAVA
jgi:AraC-like DNA-binding protein